MKKMFIALFAILFSIAVISCDEDSTGPSEVQKGEMEASVDGDNWEATTLTATYATTPFESYTVVGTKSMVTQGRTEQISITFLPGNSTGTGSFSTNEAGEANTWTSDNVTVTTTIENDTEVKGSFSFTGKNMKDNSEIVITGSFYSDVTKL